MVPKTTRKKVQGYSDQEPIIQNHRKLALGSSKQISMLLEDVLNRILTENVRSKALQLSLTVKQPYCSNTEESDSNQIKISLELVNY